MASWLKYATISLCVLAILVVLILKQNQSSTILHSSLLGKVKLSDAVQKEYEKKVTAPILNDFSGESTYNNMEVQNLAWIADLNDTTQYKDELLKTQLERMNRITQVCSVVPKLSNQLPGRAQFIQFKSNQVVYCVIPKTGTTNLLRKFCMLIGPNCTRDIGGQNEHVYMIYSGRFTSKLSLHDLQQYSRHSIDQTSPYTEQHRNFLFTVVRNPWERLISFFIEKFISTKEYMSYCGVKHEWAKFQEMKDATNTSWTFRDCLEKCVIHQYDTRGIPGMNEHFRPQFTSGAFCDIRYNFVAKLESFKNDEAAIMKQFDGAAEVDQLGSEAFKFRKMHEKSGTTKQSAKSYWQTIDPLLMQRLKQIYYIDLIMFGYPGDPT